MKALLAALAIALACAALARPSHSRSRSHSQVSRTHHERSDAGYDDEEDRA